MKKNVILVYMKIQKKFKKNLQSAFHQTLEDNTLTVRFRDTMEQIRIPMAELSALVTEKVSLSAQFSKL